MGRVVVSFDVLPDCSVCGGPLVLDVDVAQERHEFDEPIEVCAQCGLAQTPGPRLNGIKAAVREVVRRRPMLCPSCLYRRCDRCCVATCECPRRRHPNRPERGDG
jgi:hypothetical protein